ncbi:hypothetical protein [Caldimonas tepidiphila]|uniref:hypothetical protein n=1 Tax=Caldimonas tepidiphila TaxID=2315841 RepID=UPI000E5A64BA|nr:hypothetical protein [Caldimonas tepidiphila]
MYEPTIPFGEPELLRSSTYLQAVEEVAGGGAITGALSDLSPSLRADLQRFVHRPQGADVLEVLAACLRHAHSAAVQLDAGGFVLPLTVFPRERLYHCPVSPRDFLQQRFGLLKVLRVEGAVLRPPGDDEKQLIASPDSYHAIGPLLWELAMEGCRSELLPEIAGPACYRTAPGIPFESLHLRRGHHAALHRMHTHPVTLRELAELPAMDPDSAARLLNGLYLQSGLIISRTLPAALAAAKLGGSWLPSLRWRRG